MFFINVECAIDIWRMRNNSEVGFVSYGVDKQYIIV